MDAYFLQEFLFWCMIINLGIYCFTAIAVVTMRDFVCKTQEWFFGTDRETSLKLVQRYLATYKLLITVFNFTPWIALLILNR